VSATIAEGKAEDNLLYDRFIAEDGKGPYPDME
jgi:hypothetical protein